MQAVYIWGLAVCLIQWIWQVSILSKFWDKIASVDSSVQPNRNACRQTRSNLGECELLYFLPLRVSEHVRNRIRQSKTHRRCSESLLSALWLLDCFILSCVSQNNILYSYGRIYNHAIYCHTKSFTQKGNDGRCLKNAVHLFWLPVCQTTNVGFFLI